MAVIRGTALSGFRALVRDLGGDPEPLLAGAGIESRAVGDHEAFISYRGMIDAVETAAAVTGTPDFGRRLANRQGLEILGPVGVAARTAPTLGTALGSVGQYLRTYSPALAVSLDRPAGWTHHRFRLDILLPHLPDHRQTIELSIGVALRVLRTLVGDDFVPERVHLPHAAVDSEWRYAQHFGAPVEFTDTFAGFTLTAPDLDRPVADDDGVHRVVRDYLDGLTGGHSGDLVANVRAIVRPMLSTSSLELGLVADSLYLHRRTLQRRLADAGTCFERIVDEERRDLAAGYLRDTDLTLTQISNLLGYSEPSVFSRRSRSWFGMAPAKARTNLRTGRGGS